MIEVPGSNNHIVPITNHQTCESIHQYSSVDPNCSRHLYDEGQNNQHLGCPAIMSDGRALTDHRQANHRELHNQKKIKETNSSTVINHHDERAHHNKHSDKIIDEELHYINLKLNCNCCDAICQARKVNPQ